MHRSLPLALAIVWSLPALGHADTSVGDAPLGRADIRCADCRILLAVHLDEGVLTWDGGDLVERRDWLLLEVPEIAGAAYYFSDGKTSFAHSLGWPGRRILVPIPRGTAAVWSEPLWSLVGTPDPSLMPPARRGRVVARRARSFAAFQDESATER